MNRRLSITCAAAAGFIASAMLAAPCLAQQLSPYEQAKAHQYLRVRLADTEENLAQCLARMDESSMNAEARLKWVLDNWVNPAAKGGTK